MAENQTKQPTIKLDSSDGETFEVELDVIKLSNTINTMLQGTGVCLAIEMWLRALIADLGMDATGAGDAEETSSAPIPLENVNAAILKKVYRDGVC